MESLFDQGVAQRYDQWYLSPVGRYVEQVENQLMLDILRVEKEQSLLDVGCGTGNHLLLFQQFGLDVVGVDPSESMLAIARDKMGHRAELYPGVAEDLPFDDNRFDVVTLLSSLEFCSEPILALAEAFRVARRQVFLGVLNRFSTSGVHRKAESFLRPTIFRYAHFFSIWELKYMIREILGACPIKWGSVNWLPLPFLRWNRLLDRWMPRYRNPFGAFLCVRIEIAYTHKAILHPLGKRPARLAGSGSPVGCLHMWGTQEPCCYEALAGDKRSGSSIGRRCRFQALHEAPRLVNVWTDPCRVIVKR